MLTNIRRDYFPENNNQLMDNSLILNYLTNNQIKKILKYLHKINKLNPYKNKDCMFSNIKVMYQDTDEEDTDEEYYKNNEKIINDFNNTKNYKNNIKKDYIEYLSKLGFELNDKNIPTPVFELINNGIII